MNLELVGKQLTDFCRYVLFAGAHSEAEHLKYNKIWLQCSRRAESFKI